jgi:3-deoxy-D-manno-octulosonate 8-phosphate phosphatase (KDO 8-P phosphatase)
MDPARIRLLILDVDGVLTDGRVSPGSDGEWAKEFCIQDGCAIKLWRRCGGQVALLSGRSDAVVERRATELGIEIVRTGAADKSSAYNAILASVGCGDEAVAYVGDDLPDGRPMSQAGFPVAVANAHPAVKRISMYVTRRRGGCGAVAELVELLLRKQSRWSPALMSPV